MTLSLPDLIRRSLFEELEDIKGMKTLIMDSITMGIIDLACSKSLIMKKEVFLFEDIHKFRVVGSPSDSRLSHLKAVVVVRSMNENIESLISALKQPLYHSYHLFFTNKIDSMTVKRLAEADMNEVVKSIKEIYIDLEPLLENVFILKPLEGSNFAFKTRDIKRFSEGLSAACKLLRMTSSCVLYQSTSVETDRIAHSLSSSLESSSNGFKDDGIILILDRRFDSLTPLVFNWTYLSLIHELLGLNNNKVSYIDSSSKSQTSTFSPETDEFYSKYIFADYGQFCSSIKKLVHDFQCRRNEHDSMDSLGDIKDFISRYPEFKKLSGIVDKHVSVVDEISKKVQERDLLNISLLEQDVVVTSTQSTIVNKLKRDLLPSPSLQNKPKMGSEDLFRVLLIVALKLKDTSFLNQIQGGITNVNFGEISAITNYIGRNFELIQKDTNRQFPGGSDLINEFKAVDNVYTRYQPRLKDVLSSVMNGDIQQLNLNTYGSYTPSKKILVFIMGGLTCAEIAMVHSLNKEKGARIVIGGSSLLNSESLIKDLSRVSRI